MKISIAMATYNGAKYLQQQLDSFLNQTRLPDELVISDDCSTDATLDIVERFKSRAPFKVIILRNETNLGYTANFSRALSATSGDIVFLSDQDDVWFSNKIATMEEIAERNPEALAIMCDAALTDGQLKEAGGLTQLGQIRSAGLPDSSFVMGCCAAIRRPFLNLVLPIPDSYPGHDSWIIRMAEGVGGKLLHEEVLQYYRRHGTNASQFVAQRLTKVTKKDVWSGRLRSAVDLLSGRDAQRMEASLNHAVLFLQGVDGAIARCNEDCEEWTEYREEVRRHVQALRVRREIHRRRRLKRIYTVFSFWRAGGYVRFSGLYSVVCDLIAPRVEADGI